MILLSVDPGIRGAGCAVFSDSVLLAAGYVKSIAKEGAGPRECADAARAIVIWLDNTFPDTWPSVLALEVPQTYGGRSSKGDANDLMPLWGVQGALAYAFPAAKVEAFIPHAWKGSLSKPTTAGGVYLIRERVLAALSDEEKGRVEWPKAGKLQWDVADAVGIGLHALGRFSPRRVFLRE